MKKNNKMAVAIIRVSSLRQKDNISTEVQETEIRAYCKVNGLELVELHSIVESAKDSNTRKKYKKIMATALEKRIHHVVFYMLDRETRNLTDNERNEMLVRAGVITLHYVRDRKTLSRDSPDSDFFMRDMQAVTNRHFIRNLSAKVEDAMTRKAELGWFPSNHVPLGYIHQRLKDEAGRDKKRGTIIVPDADFKNIKLVQREFELRALGLTYREIRETVVKEGLVPSRLIKSYRENTVHKRLTNPFYLGKFKWKGNLYDGKHELIIPREVLDKVFAFPGKRYSSANTQTGAIFANGWLRCGIPTCGCQVIFDPKTKVKKSNGEKREFKYYHCTNGKKIHKTMRGMNATEEKIWQQFSQAVDAISISPELAFQVAEALNQVGVGEVESQKRNTEMLATRIKEISEEEDDLYRDFKRGLIDDEQFQRMKGVLKTEKINCGKGIESAMRASEEKIRETADSILELAKDAKTLWLGRSPQERRDFLDLILSNPKLDGTTVRYDLKKPFCVLSEMSQKEDWRSQGDSNPCILREREVS